MAVMSATSGWLAELFRVDGLFAGERPMDQCVMGRTRGVREGGLGWGAGEKPDLSLQSEPS
jgi:hypothetical protein